MDDDDASRFDYRGWMAKNLWHSVDAHFHDGAGSVSLSLVLLKAAYSLIIYTNDQISFELPDLQHQY